MKDKGILTVKGLAIIGVVFHHIGNRRFDSDARDAIAILPAIFSWCVLAFFAASGWLHALSEENKMRTFTSFLKLRLIRLVFPFLVLILLYSCVWSLIQTAGFSGLRGSIPASFFGKIWESIPPTHGHEVAEQLYFMPLLFFICILVHGVLRVSGLPGVVILSVVSLIVGLSAFPYSSNVGFSLGVAVWGTFVYATGFWMYRNRSNHWPLLIAIGSALIVFLVIGPSGLQKVVPIFLLAIMHPLRFGSVPMLPQVGEASATIYVYHTPFILQPFIIVSSLLFSGLNQFYAAIVAGFLALGVCMLLFYRLRSTRMGFAIL